MPWIQFTAKSAFSPQRLKRLKSCSESLDDSFFLSLNIGSWIDAVSCAGNMTQVTDGSPQPVRLNADTT
jgi:hypothetical protein